MADPILIRAVLAALLSSVVAGFAGALCARLRLVSAGGGISHVAFGGAGVAALLGTAPLPTALVAALIGGVVLWHLERRSREEADMWTAVVWALGMAVGVVARDLAPPGSSSWETLLLGNLLLVPDGDFSALILVAVILSISVLLLRTEWAALAADPVFAKASGLPVDALRLLSILLVALATVVLMRTAGILLVVAWLSLPAALAGRPRGGFTGLALVTTAWTAGTSLTGLALGWIVDVSPAALAVLVAGCALGIQRTVRRGVA